jgi:oxygen-independent coproporphyrinogen-3 oxidase
MPAGMPPAAIEIESFLPLAEPSPETGLFARRAPMMPWRGQVPVPAEQVAEVWAGLSAMPRREPTVAYVHIPFCHNHCLFCGFYQNPHAADRSAWFVDHLIAEIRQRADDPLVRQGPAISAVYLGGGTPTSLQAPDIGRLITALREGLPLASDCEITLEGRLYDFGLAKAEAAVAAGATRISLGVQCFDTVVRRRLGRKLDREAVLGALRELVADGRAAVVIDLLFGLPGQTDAVWADDLETALSLGLDGLDHYALMVWPHVPLAQAVESGKALPLPPLAAQTAFYLTAVERLDRAGCRRLSAQHVAFGSRERNVYNRFVKAGATCLAYGPGAGGSGHQHS